MKASKETLTLNNAWVRCHRMWRHIYDRIRHEGKVESISEMKTHYLKKVLPYAQSIQHDCWFCAYAFDRNVEEFGAGSIHIYPYPIAEAHEKTCKHCPAKLVDPKFNCQDPHCHWGEHPIQFYNKIRSMYRVWQAMTGDALK